MCGPGELIGGAFPAFSTFRRSLLISDVCLGGGAAPAPQIRGRASLVYGKGLEGSPGAARCPRGVLRGRERSRVLRTNAATDVLHEGPEARGGDDRARRLAAGEGLPGGRHRRRANLRLPRLAPSARVCLRFGRTPLLFSGHVPLSLRFGGLAPAAGGRFPAAGTRPFACQFEFPSSFCCMRRRELSRAAIPVAARSRRRPHACAAAEPRTMPVKSRRRAGLMHLVGLRARGPP